MPYKRSHRNIHRTVLARAGRFMASQPWLMTDPERCRTVQTFIEKCLKDYGYEVTVPVRTSYYAPGPLGFEAEREQGEDTLGDDSHTWLLLLGPKHSTPVVFTALRYILLSEKGEVDPITDGPDVAGISEWANALLFTVNPFVFRKLARKGRLVGVKPIDTFSADDAALLAENGYVREDGHLVNWTPETLGILHASDTSEPEEASEEVVDELDVASEPSESPQETTDGVAEGVQAWNEHYAESLDALNRDQVRDEARRLGIRNVSSHTRADLIDLITRQAGLSA